MRASGESPLKNPVTLAADATQIRIEPALVRLDEDLPRRLERRNAVRPEIAEIDAQPAPRAERPRAAPEREAERLDFAHAVFGNARE